MKLTSLHVLLTYKCVYECDHCFVWGSLQQSGVFTLDRLDVVLEQAVRLGTVREIAFEGGETLVYYPTLITAVRRAARQFNTAIVTNGYWATTVGDATNWLKRLVDAGLRRIQFFLDERQAAGELHPGVIAARELGLETRVLRRATSRLGREACSGNTDEDVHFRSSDATRPPSDIRLRPWDSFTTCPYENLSHPSRVHVDPFGYLHLCQGLVIGNLFDRSLQSVVAGYAPGAHPIVGPLIAGGPAELVRRYGLEPQSAYLDACYLCYSSREELRTSFPSELCPEPIDGSQSAITGGEHNVVSNRKVI